MLCNFQLVYDTNCSRKYFGGGTELVTPFPTKLTIIRNIVSKFQITFRFIEDEISRPVEAEF